MRTVRDACSLQDNALTVKLSDQIEQLDELITIEGDGSAFFEKTFITQGMRDLIAAFPPAFPPGSDRVSI